MQTKSALEMYILFNTDINKESIYDNGALLVEARTGVLWTKTCRAQYEDIYGEGKETTEHLILYCKGIHPAVARGNNDPVKALGSKIVRGKETKKRWRLANRGWPTGGIS